MDAPLQNWQQKQQQMQQMQPQQQPMQPQQQPNMQFIPAQRGAAPASPSSNAGFATGPAPVPQPNSAALNSAQVQDSGAQDVEPVQPDMQARPTQSSSENIERQADSFEEELLGIF